MALQAIGKSRRSCPNKHKTNIYTIDAIDADFSHDVVLLMQSEVPRMAHPKGPLTTKDQEEEDRRWLPKSIHRKKLLPKTELRPA
jgi:hypothetical protein